MNPATATPSRFLRLYSAFARWMLVLTLSGWGMLILGWAALHWFIVPRIDDFRAQLETRASQAVGMQVQIGAISAYPNGLIPSVEIKGIRVLDSQGRDALVLGKIVTSISPQSALRLGFDQLYLEAPALEVRKTVQGKIFVGGIELVGSSENTDSALTDWLFSQREILIHNGSLHWTDESLSAGRVSLSNVELLFRNGFRSHKLQLDAELPAQMGKAIRVAGDFRQPLISRGNGNWKEWAGQIYTAFDQLDLAQVQQHLPLEPKLTKGVGALRAWATVDKGVFTEATADLALSGVDAKLASEAPALQLRTTAGRISGQRLGEGFVVATNGLQFQTQDGVVWPGGNFMLKQEYAKGGTDNSPPKAAWALKADQIDLGVLGQLANQLPLANEVRQRLAVLSPKGRIVALDGKWRGGSVAGGAVEDLQVKAELRDLAFSSMGANLPALRGASLDLEFAAGKGKAKLAIDDGEIDVAGLIDRPRLLLKHLAADIHWQMAGEQVAVQIPNLQFSNADGQGELVAKWHSQVPDLARGRGRFPGVLDLQASLSRAEAASVIHYLPLVIQPQVRDYLRQAIRKGQAKNAKFRIKGDLYDFPFVDAKQGDFRISANLSEVQFAYVPAPLLPQGNLAWPELANMSAEFVLERNQLHLRNGTGRLAQRNGTSTSTSTSTGTSPVQFTKAEAHIPDLLKNPTVQVSGDARGSLGNMLLVVNTSPLRDMTGRALVQATGSGNADLKLKLAVPVLDLAKVSVQGTLALADNDIRISNDTPKLSRVKGTVNFSEAGFTLSGMQGRLFGGDVTLSGGTQTPVLAAVGSSGTNAPPPVNDSSEFQFPPIALRVAGMVTAEGLRQAPELGLLARIAEQASGSTDFTAVLGVKQGQSEINVTSSLVGLALKLPQPLSKEAQVPLPIRFQSLPVGATGAAAGQDTVRLDIGRLASFYYMRDTNVVPARVLRGSIALGLAADEVAPMPVQGVYANLNLNQVDVDAWIQQFSRTVEAPATPAALPDTATAPNPRNSNRVAEGAGRNAATRGNATTANAGSQASAVASYLPTLFAVRATELMVGGRKVNKLVVGGSLDGNIWRANIEAAELDGYAEYRQPGPGNAGRIYARLARLTLAQQSVKEVETLLDEQPASVPALDIVVDDLQLRDKKLGRLELEAINRNVGVANGTGREWRLAKMSLQMPEASLAATGNWTALNAQSQTLPPTLRSGAPARRTVLNFKLDINDSGKLLERFGMREVVRLGKGSIDGQVNWLGSPLQVDYPSLGGAFTVNVENGQFLKADPGLAKLLGVLSLQSLPRRLALDFRDVFSEGFAFDFVRGDVKIDQGMASTNNMQMKGVNAAVLLEGRADIANETQQLRVVVVPELNAGTASLVATAINPLVGIGTFLAQLILRRPLIESATQEFVVDGTWVDPKVTRVPRKPPAPTEPQPGKTP